MAERSVTMASPLYSDGVHHAEVHSPYCGQETPDPLNYLTSSPPEHTFLTAGGGDDVNEWKAEFPDERDEQGY